MSPITSTRVNRRQAGRGRFYIDARGDRYWSVTTLLKGVPKDALMYWSAKEAAIYAVDNLKKLQAMTADDEDGSGREAAIRLVKDACWRSSGKKMELGSMIHEIVESLVLDRPMPPVADDAAPYVDQFLAFAQDWGPEWIASELTVYNRTQKYAGTLDLIAKVAGETLLIDTKTGKCPTNSSGDCVGAYPDTALQLAMYRYAEFVELPDGSERELPDIDGAAVLHLAADHYSLVPMRCDEDVFNVALWAREIYRWLNETSKEVVGTPKVRARAVA